MAPGQDEFKLASLFNKQLKEIGGHTSRFLFQCHRLVHALRSQNVQQEKLRYILLANAQQAETNVYIKTINGY